MLGADTGLRNRRSDPAPTEAAHAVDMTACKCVQFGHAAGVRDE